MTDIVAELDAVIEAAMKPRRDWRTDAACVGVALEEFYGDIPSAQARAACGRCAVRIDCIAEETGIPSDEVCGFRGGLSEGERRRLLASVARELPRDREHLADVKRAFARGVSPALLAEQLGVSVRTAYRWRAESRRAAS